MHGLVLINFVAFLISVASSYIIPFISLQTRGLSTAILPCIAFQVGHCLRVLIPKSELYDTCVCSCYSGCSFSFQGHLAGVGGLWPGDVQLPDVLLPHALPLLPRHRQPPHSSERLHSVPSGHHLQPKCIQVPHPHFLWNAKSEYFARFHCCGDEFILISATEGLILFRLECALLIWHNLWVLHHANVEYCVFSVKHRRLYYFTSRICTHVHWLEYHIYSSIDL